MKGMQMTTLVLVVCVAALAEGRLCCLLAARSTERGVKSTETPESIQRFSGGLAEVLRRHVKG